MTPYAISSDQHCHDWSQFSKIDADGVNSRLRAILNELERKADTLLAAGGDVMFLAGDLFHVRGKIDPEVLNPTMSTFKRICAKGIRVCAIAGNHDLKGAHSTALGNAMQSLDEIDNFTAVVSPMLVQTASSKVMMIPWIEDLDELRSTAKNVAAADRDLIIHAPINGVLKGLPDLGLDPAEIAAWGYRRVFCGHYHNHKEFPGGVFSIGATTHQTWSDPGTKAGFLLVGDDVEFHETHAPKFVNVDSVGEITRSNVHDCYVRLRLQDLEPAQIEEAKRKLVDNGAINWVDHSSKKRPTIRKNASTGKTLTIEASVSSFINDHLEAPGLDKNRIAKDALSVLSEARSVGDE